MPDQLPGDEMLMAYADDELEGATKDAVARLAAADPRVAARIEAFRTSREAARESFADVLAEAPPQRLLDALGEPPAKSVVRLPGRRRWPAAVLPLAAGFAVAIAIAIVLAGRDPGIRGVPLDRIVAGHLPDLMSGSETVVATSEGEATLRAVGAYRAGGRLCRTFSLESEGGLARGIGCGGASGWSLEALVENASAGGFTTAADPATERIDAALERLRAEGPLSPEEEAALAAAHD